MGPLASWSVTPLPSLSFWCAGPRRGHGPHAGASCSGHGDHDRLGLFACGHALALPWTEPALGLLPDGLDGCGELCQAQVQGSTTWSRRPGGPGPFAQGTPGLGLPSFGHAPLRPARPTGRFRGCAPPIMQERSRVLQACEVPQCRPGGHRHGARATAQGREGLAP